MKKISLELIRKEIIGNDALYITPFGKRNLFYADYTASGRNLRCIEKKLLDIEKYYANTHTVDDYSGEYLTSLLHGSEKEIKKMINAGDEYRIISVGSGSTGALKRLQEILGVYIPPHTKDRIFSSISELNCDNCNILEKINIDKPVIFIGPYEHHTNELMWRESFADVVVIGLNEEGGIDLDSFESEISKEEYKERVKFCSFSAGSNITGMLSDTKKIADTAHANNALVFFDYAAVAPYIEINVKPGKNSYFDAVFFSPHKFLGGPGSSGILVFRQDMYRKDLPPTTSGGGTVDYVGFNDQVYSVDIETREKTGTPPILQTIKSALVMDIKEKIGTAVIASIEKRYLKMFFDRFKGDSRIEIIGNQDPDKRIPIISFNIKHIDRYLHPRLVTRLLSDLFGIQSRAGCSCAGPYGHRLLGINNDVSQLYKEMITEKRIAGVKPGWVRINLHYIFTQEDIEFLMNAIDFTAKYGDRFLNLYDFDMKTSVWKHKNKKFKKPVLDMKNDYSTEDIDLSLIETIRKGYFEKAVNAAEKLKSIPKNSFKKDVKQIEDLKYFYYV